MSSTTLQPAVRPRVHDRPERAGATGVGGWFMAALVVASILNPLNTSSMATALVAIGDDLHATAAQLGMLVAAVYITSAVAQPLMGAIATRVSARRVLMAGMVMVALAGVVGATASSVTGLLASRALIGFGTSTAVPAAMVMLRRRAERLGMGTPTRQIATLTAAGNVMAVAGLPVGGFLVQAFGWRSTFMVNTPLALLALVLALVVLDARDDAPSGLPTATLDWAGVAGFAATIVALAVFLDDITRPSWAVLGLAIGAALATIWWEHHTSLLGRQAFLDVDLIASSRPLRGVYLRSFWLSLSVYLTLYVLAQWLAVVHQMSSSAVGLLMLPQSVLAAVAAVWAGHQPWVRRFIVAAGVLLGGAAVTLAAASLLDGTTAVVIAVATTIATGLAFGVGMVGNQTALYLASTSEQFGTASGLLRTSSYVGGFVAMAVMGLIFHDGASNAGLRGFALVFLVAGLVTILNARRGVPATSTLERNQP